MSLHPTFDLVIPVYGTLQIAFTQADHAHVYGDMTVRGVQYRVGVHIFEHSDRRFHLSRENDTPYQQHLNLYVNRIGDWKKTPSDAARRTIQEQIELAANNFIANNRSVLSLAEGNKLRQAVESAEHAYAEALQAMDKARVARDEAQFAEDQFRAGRAVI